MDSIDNYNTKLNELINKKVSSNISATGSDLNEILGTDKLEQAKLKIEYYAGNAFNEFKNKLINEGKIDAKSSSDLGFVFGFNRGIIDRYACRKSLFKTAYDKKLLRSYYLKCKTLL